jgi:hypothetical protein
MPVVAIPALAVAVLASGLGNGFAYDDVRLLVQDPRLHDLGTLGPRLAESWWPTGLYRPVSLGALGLQWIVDDGAPLVFRLVSTALYATICALVFRLALLARAGVGPAAAGAALFAVHPVHSEVTANVVGQAELLSTLAVLAGVLWYLRARERGPLGMRDTVIVSLLAFTAANAKESGYVLPGLLVLAELLVVRDSSPLRQRLTALRRPALILTAVILASLALRVQVLGALGGETPHPSLDGLLLVERVIAMLVVVPEWARLLLWPAHLQAEYGPPGLMMDPVPGGRHLLGAVLVLGAAVALIGTWRRQPLVAFGLMWTAVALAPVANILAPTGILLAERTLFLPSVGVALIVGGVGKWLSERPAVSFPVRLACVVVLTGLVVAGGIVSARRQPLWRDTLTILEQTTRDAPRSYRAFSTYGRELQWVGRAGEAEEAFRRAIALWDRDPRPFEELGQLLRVRGACGEAISVLQRGLLADSTSDVARSRLIECLIVERRWDEAEVEIERGLAQGVTAYQSALARVQAGREADSAKAQGFP